MLDATFGGTTSLPVVSSRVEVVLSLLGLGRGGSWELHLTARSAILWFVAVSFPMVAVLRALYIARTGHNPRRQDLVRERDD